MNGTSQNTSTPTNSNNTTANNTDKTQVDSGSSNSSNLVVIVSISVAGVLLLATALIILAFRMKLKKIKNKSIYASTGRVTHKEKTLSEMDKVKTIKLESIKTTKIVSNRNKKKSKQNKDAKNVNVIITPRENLKIAAINSPNRTNFREKLNQFIYQLRSPEKKSHITDSNFFEATPTAMPRIIPQTIRASFININNIINVKSSKSSSAEQELVTETIKNMNNINTENNLNNLENLMNSRAELMMPDTNPSILVLTNNVINLRSNEGEMRSDIQNNIPPLPVANRMCLYKSEQEEV